MSPDIDIEAPGICHDGWYARHDLLEVPQLAALGDDSVRTKLLSNPDYWKGRAHRPPGHDGPLTLSRQPRSSGRDCYASQDGLSDAMRPTNTPEHLEAFGVLRDMADRGCGDIPAGELARHILHVTEGADWPVQRAAMAALLRRRSIADRSELRISKRPSSGRRLGDYTTRTPGRKGERPYLTRLTSIDPIAGSCNCRDFARSSLGLCKHLLVVLSDLFASQRKLSQAKREAPLSSRLGWDPIRPLDGPGDWLAGVHLNGSGGRRRKHVAFNARTGRLKQTHAGAPRKRLELIRGLLRLRPADPALRALLDREKAKLIERCKTAELATATRTWRAGLKRKLYAYQRDGVRRFLQTGRLLLGDDMGLGKTTQAIAACHALMKAKLVKRGLIIVPASLKSQWLREWQATTAFPAAIVEGSPSEREEQYAALGRGRGFLILNYELLLRDASRLHAIRPDMVVLDEAQRIKNWATKTAAHVKTLRVPYRLVLTGTPLENRIEELASIYDWVDDLALEPKWRLLPWHSIQIQQGGRGEIVGARNLDTLRERMRDTFLRRVRKDVLSQLPPRADTRVPIPMTAEQLAEHAELERPIARLVRMAKKRPLKQAEFLRLMVLLTTQRIICNGIAQLEFDNFWPSLPPAGPQSPLQLQGLFAPKLTELRRLIEELVIDQGRKVVVFSQWRRMLRLAAWSVADVLAEHGRRAVFFTGAESQRQRTRGVIELHDDPHTSVMFLSDAGGVGLNLQRAASACINLELPWNPAVLEQRISRIYRLGQENPVDIFNLVTEIGIEARIADIVSTKQELFTGLFDGTSDEIMYSTAGSGMAQIERLVEAASIPDPSEDEDVDAPPEAEDALVVTTELAAESPSLPPPPPPPHADVQKLLASLSVRSTPSGGISIEAPPEAAQTLASLFGAMAKLLGDQQPHPP